MDNDLIFAQITIPVGMSKGEAVTRAINLVPGATHWEEIQEEDGWVVGNLVCDEGTYTGDDESFGPDDAGVTVSWEAP